MMWSRIPWASHSVAEFPPKPVTPALRGHRRLVTASVPLSADRRAVTFPAMFCQPQRFNIWPAQLQMLFRVSRDYWLSLLFKRLAGPKVLAVHVAGLQREPRPGRVIRDKLRIYAHCTSSHNHNYVRGSITLYIINLHRSRKKIKLVGTLRDKIVHQYLLQPHGKDGLHARSVQLNGQLLAMADDGTLPELKPRPLRAGRTLVIPPLTMSFYVVKNVNALACRYR
ncbi:unnamed protein product [Caretta caretta]